MLLTIRGIIPGQTYTLTSIIEIILEETENCLPELGLFTILKESRNSNAVKGAYAVHRKSWDINSFYELDNNNALPFCSSFHERSS